MEIVAHGIDLVDCPRIEEMLKRHSRRFVNRIFTAAEQTYAQSNKDPVEKFAGRFAAKEAVLKLMGTGWRGKIAWTDIEVVNNNFGQPEVTLRGEVKKIADKLGKKVVTNSVMLGFMIACTTVISKKSIEDTIRDKVPKQTIDLNLKALNEGIKYWKSKGKL